MNSEEMDGWQMAKRLWGWERASGWMGISREKREGGKEGGRKRGRAEPAAGGLSACMEGWRDTS